MKDWKDDAAQTRNELVKLAGWLLATLLSVTFWWIAIIAVIWTVKALWAAIP